MNKNFSELSLGASVYIMVAVITLAIWVYGIIKIAGNYLIFEKYPISNSGMGMMFGGGYYQTEADCLYYRSYYGPDGMATREPTTIELSAENDEKQRCLENVAEARKLAKVNDIAGSMLSLAIGLGLLYARKYILH